MVLYGATIFLSAFLLFEVQPLIGKYILPWFGGTPAVWTTCMLFFQMLLLGGYGYAHLLASRFAPKKQSILHLVLLGATALSLPIIPAEAWKPLPGQSPVWLILGLLLLTIGAPYFLLSSTAPLLQSWFSRTHEDKSPYPLYSLSNLGALVAILSYPVLVEPALSLTRQAQAWSYGYAGFVLSCSIIAWRLLRLPAAAKPSPEGFIPERRHPRASNHGVGNRVLWVGLTACSSIMLLATTNQMCQDVAVVPLLWVLPLGLYLASFILCFQDEAWYSRSWYGPALAGAAVLSCIILFGDVYLDIRFQIISYSFTLFVCCMVCHGELFRLKPGPDRLTSFYLMVAAGGALGGFFITVPAPQIFHGYWEYHLGLAGTALLLLIVVFRDREGPMYRGRPVWAWGLLSVSFAGLVVVLGIHIRQPLRDDVEVTRNFFGVLRVLEQDKDNPEEHRFTLMHGRIEHGYQLVDSEKRYWPTSYFGPESGIGVAIRFHPRRLAGGAGHGPLRIGVVGLGTGTIATYGEDGDYIRFYEINPEVVRLSDKYFTYRKDSAARIEVVLGDARVSMEREKENHDSQQFDILAVDAFSSDAIPVHLLTSECFQTYLYHLKEDGILAVHISNRYFELSPVVRSMALLDQEQGMLALHISTVESAAQETDSSEWVLLTSNQEFLTSPEVRGRESRWREPLPRPLLWTDDYSNLFSLLRR